MYSKAKNIATAAALVVFSMQIGSDTAVASYSPSAAAVTPDFDGAILGSPISKFTGGFNIGKISPESYSSFLAIEPHVAKLTPEITIPETPKAKPENSREQATIVVPKVVQPLPRPRVEPRVAMLAPVAPSLLDVPPAHHRAARPHARIDQIKFEGPAGAPFAHTRFCLKNPGDCLVPKTKLVFRGSRINLTEARRHELVRVNTKVNRSIIGTPMNEAVAQEQWLISPKYGDCNDFAVTKRHELLARGWPARSLLLAEVVVPWGEHHVVVVVRTTKGDIVLDNLNANLRSVIKTPYQWVRVQSPVNPMFWSKIQVPQANVAMNPTDSAL